MYYSPSEIEQAVSVRESKGTLLREVMDIESLIESGEINEAEECLKCGGDKDCHHMESQKVNSSLHSNSDILDAYWDAILAEKNETRHL